MGRHPSQDELSQHSFKFSIFPAFIQFYCMMQKSVNHIISIYFPHQTKTKRMLPVHKFLCTFQQCNFTSVSGIKYKLCTQAFEEG